MCSDCVPPSTPASASIAVRVMLLSGCWAVSDTPAVCTCVRISQLRGSVAPNVSRSSRAQIRRAARSLAISSKKSICALKKKLSRGAKSSTSRPARDRLLDVGQPVLERERELLRRRRAGLADVIAADRHRVPARHRARAPLDHVAEQPHRRIDREAPLLLRDVLLEDVGLDRAAQPVGRHAVLLGRDDVEREHDRRRRVDRHRDADLAEVDPAEQRLHVIERVDRDALAADLALRARRVRVVAHQRRHVERRRQPGLAVVEQVAEALVGLLRGPEAGELAHRPEPAAVHARVHAARERILARQPDPLRIRQVRLGVERPHRLARERRERRAPLRRRGVALAVPALVIRQRPLLGGHGPSLGVDSARAAARIRTSPFDRSPVVPRGCRPCKDAPSPRPWRY